jgi:hypothetical protein
MANWEDIQNLLTIGLLILLAIGFIYGLSVGFSKMIRAPAPAPAPAPASTSAGSPSELTQEGFLDFGLSKILSHFDAEGNLIVPEAPTPTPATAPVNHEKNAEVAPREEESLSVEELSDPDSDPSTLYVQDLYPNENKYDYTLSMKGEPHLTILGYMDGPDIHLSVRGVEDRKVVTKIRHKLYGTYETIYQREGVDEAPIIYRFEREEDKVRFMKIASEKEDEVFFLEKIQGEERVYEEDSSRIPLCKIMYFSKKVGTISSQAGSQYAIQVDPDYVDSLDVIGFGWVLHHALEKEAEAEAEAEDEAEAEVGSNSLDID